MPTTCPATECAARLTHQQVELLADFYRKHTGLDAALIGLPSEPEGIADPDFKSADCPPGFDTSVGYLTEHLPHVWDLMDQFAEATRADDLALKRAARAQGLPTKQVAAPAWLVRQGVFEVRAFPLALLKEHFGD